MTEIPDTPPDRLSIDPRSPHFDGDVLERGIGIRFKGTERTNVIEYCLSEGWIRVQAGKSRDRHGNPMTARLDGPVEAWFQDTDSEKEKEKEKGSGTEDAADDGED